MTKLSKAIEELEELAKAKGPTKFLSKKPDGKGGWIYKYKESGGRRDVNKDSKIINNFEKKWYDTSPTGTFKATEENVKLLEEEFKRELRNYDVGGELHNESKENMRELREYRKAIKRIKSKK